MFHVISSISCPCIFAFVHTIWLFSVLAELHPDNPTSACLDIGALEYQRLSDANQSRSGSIACPITRTWRRLGGLVADSPDPISFI